MSNNHNGANCAVVAGFNGIPFPLTNTLDYVNPLFLKNGTIAKRNGTFFAKTAAIPSGNSWGLVINGSSNGCQWKLDRKRVQHPFPFY